MNFRLRNLVSILLIKMNGSIWHLAVLKLYEMIGRFLRDEFGYKRREVVRERMWGGDYRVENSFTTTFLFWRKSRAGE